MESDESETWIELSAATRNVVALLLLRNSGKSGNELLTATATGGSVKSEAVAVSAAITGASADLKLQAVDASGQGGDEAAIAVSPNRGGETDSSAATNLSSTSFQHDAQSTVFASMRRKAGDGHREHFILHRGAMTNG